MAWCVWIYFKWTLPQHLQQVILPSGYVCVCHVVDIKFRTKERKSQKYFEYPIEQIYRVMWKNSPKWPLFWFPLFLSVVIWVILCVCLVGIRCTIFTSMAKNLNIWFWSNRKSHLCSHWCERKTKKKSHTQNTNGRINKPYNRLNVHWISGF